MPSVLRWGQAPFRVWRHALKLTHIRCRSAWFGWCLGCHVLHPFGYSRYLDRSTMPVWQCAGIPASAERACCLRHYADAAGSSSTARGASSDTHLYLLVYLRARPSDLTRGRVMGASCATSLRDSGDYPTESELLKRCTAHRQQAYDASPIPLPLVQSLTGGACSVPRNAVFKSKRKWARYESCQPHHGSVYGEAMDAAMMNGHRQGYSRSGQPHQAPCEFADQETG